MASNNYNVSSGSDNFGTPNVASGSDNSVSSSIQM